MLTNTIISLHKDKIPKGLVKVLVGITYNTELSSVSHIKITPPDLKFMTQGIQKCDIFKFPEIFPNRCCFPIKCTLKYTCFWFPIRTLCPIPKNQLTRLKKQWIRSNILAARALDSRSRGTIFKTTGWLKDQLSLSSFQGQSSEHQ